MNANDTVREMLKREHISAERVALGMGKSKSYLTSFLATRVDPRTATLVNICDYLGYDLIARDRSDGYEFFIGP